MEVRRGCSFIGFVLTGLAVLATVARGRWNALTMYETFEHAVILIVTGLIAVVIVTAVWHLTVNIVVRLLLSEAFDPTDHSVFQAVFGMIFTVIIALEFKRSLLVVAERRSSIVQVRTVVLLAMLAIVRKLIILNLKTTEALQLLALAAAVLALGAVHWLVRDQDRRDIPRPPANAGTREPTA
ncbi:MAG TPA: phosphate-starvation-inducible PsiE family protein, partial [Methylomirabilota bacterium]